MFHRNLLGIALGLSVMLLTVTTSSHAADIGVAARASTQGWGAEGAVGLTKFISLRGGIYDATVTDDVDEGGINYEGDLNLGGYGLFADFFPFRGGFHVTAGLVSNDNGIELTATPTEAVEIGDTIYQPAEIGKLIGEIDFDDEAPYLGIGWGNLARGKRFGVLFDLGVIRQGDGSVSLSSTNTMVDPADLEAERKELEDDLSGYDLWPVISIGVAYRF